MPGENEDLAKSQLFTLKGEVVYDQDKTVDTMIARERIARRDLIGHVIDQKYKLVSLLGEGGMGAVYKAHHLMLNKEVALKTFRSPNLTEESWSRFQREAQAIARLSHPNIVQVFDFGVGEDNVPYYTMECLSGEALSDRLTRQKCLSLEETMRIYWQVCQGLSLAHSKGIIHRDMKPANVFMARSHPGGPADTVKIVDFGIAGLATQSLDGQKLTATGTIFGSPYYMSPEQSLGFEISERSDIYSVGCSLYETLTGRPPFRGENPFATMLLHQLEPAPELVYQPDGVQYPQRLTGLIARMLAKTERNRPQSFAEVASDLENILYGEQIKTQTGRQQSIPPRTTTGGGAGEDNEYYDGEHDETEEHTGSYEQSESENHRKRVIALSVLAAVILLAGGGAYYYFGVMRGHKGPDPLSVKSETDIGIVSEKLHPHVETNKKPYLVNIDDRGYHFVFPGESLGNLRPVFSHKMPKPRGVPEKIAARGAVTIPPTARLHFTAGSLLERQPELFDGFGPEDLELLTLDQSYNWENKHLQHIARFSGLRTLQVSNTYLKDPGVPLLEKFVRLKHLFIDHTFITAPAMAKLSILPRLDTVSICGMQNPTPVLEALATSNRVEKLYLDSCELKDSDLAIIGKFTKLNDLALRENNGLTARGFAHLANLPDLEEINIERTRLPSSILPTLQSMPKLKKLSSDILTWSPADQQKVRDGLPGVHMAHVLEPDLKKIKVGDVENTATDLMKEQFFAP